MNEDYWVTLELSRMGEKKRPEELQQLLEAEVSHKDVDIFIPAISFYRKDNAVTVCLMEGYAFVRAGHPACFYFEFEKSPYINRVLSRDERSGRYLEYVPESAISDLRRQLQEYTVREIEVGDEIIVDEGAYQNLEGTVMGLNPAGEAAYVRIHELKSLTTVVELPLQFLRKL